MRKEPYTAVARDTVLVERDLAPVARLLHLGTSQARFAEIPQQKVVVCASSGKIVAYKRTWAQCSLL